MRGNKEGRGGGGRERDKRDVGREVGRERGEKVPNMRKTRAPYFCKSGFIRKARVVRLKMSNCPNCRFYIRRRLQRAREEMRIYIYGYMCTSSGQPARPHTYAGIHTHAYTHTYRARHTSVTHDTRVGHARTYFGAELEHYGRTRKSFPRACSR